MNNKPLPTVWLATATFLLVFILQSPPFLSAQEEIKRSMSDKIFESIAESELENKQATLRTWTDPDIIRSLSNITLTDDYAKKLYGELKKTIVNPPNPDTYTEYSINNGEEVLKQSEQLGRRLHNLLMALSDEDFEKYGRLISGMREILYVDVEHIPLAIRGDNSRDIYWYELHKKGLEELEKEYLRVFGDE